MEPLATTWEQVHRKLSCIPLPTKGTACDAKPDVECKPDADHGPACALSSCGLYAAAAKDPDALLNTAQYLFHVARTGIAVHIHRGAVRCFMPFANAAYQNTFWHKVHFACGAKSVEEYAVHKAQVLHCPQEPMLPLQGWWLNGGIACNVMPKGVWGDSYNEQLLGMLRDYPVVRRDRLDPYHRFVGGTTARVPPSLLPIFSFYVGHKTADVAMPTTEDWGVALEANRWADIRDRCPFDTKRHCAVFRGSATGYGIRQRLVHASCDILDAGLTSSSKRDRVVHDPATDSVVVHVPADTLPLVPRVPLMVQAEQYRYIVYADGHCAASRYGTLMHTGCVILRVASEQDHDCGRLWLFPTLRGACLGDCAHTFQDADHVLIRADLADLLPTIQWLASTEGMRACQHIIRNAVARAPTRESIARYWAAHIRQVHATCAMAEPEKGSHAWWGIADKRYAALQCMQS
jgi:hypothetical protein